ncbi:hypothetical protein BKA70DRAFT_1246538 [Coprinopsis sp. MPI-PUGE-AT-0042]|nr:hypothetical protein BKA70DRAFT_1246538 [Coprinopsis sp. MPI-PUGE-AT-0042]
MPQRSMSTPPVSQVLRCQEAQRRCRVSLSLRGKGTNTLRRSGTSEMQWRRKSMLLSWPRGAPWFPSFKFHSTPAMNFVAYFGIVSLYGPVTELGLGWVNRDLSSERLSPSDMIWVEKYTHGGYTLFDSSNIPGPHKAHRCRLDEERTLTVRHLFDKGVTVGHKVSKIARRNQPYSPRDARACLAWRLRNKSCKEVDTDVQDGTGFIKSIDEFYRL